MTTAHEHTQFARAMPADYPDIAALQRDRPLSGDIRLALVSHPDFGQASALLPRGATFVARRGESDHIVGMATRVVQRRFWNGEPRLIGYLSQLRTVVGIRNLSPLHRGFSAVRETHASDELDFDITAIADDNAPARRLLERGLPGLPRYEPLCRLETLILPTENRGTGAAREIRALRPSDWPTVRNFLYDTLRHRPLAPAWHLQHPLAQLPGLRDEDVYIAYKDGAIAGVVMLWDQRPQRQVLVHSYAPWLGHLRLVANLAQRIVGKPRLPAPGEALALAYVACLAVDPWDEVTMLDLIDAARIAACKRRIALLATTLPRNHPNLESIRSRYRARTYGSMCYSVGWNDANTPPSLPPGGVPYLEAALL